MKRTGSLISRYFLTTIIPYFLFSWLLLSVILFVQQASRFSDTFFDINIPANLAWQLTIALIPNVVAFTCPMAILVGTIIGLTKMQGDSELAAIRAAGVGNVQIAAPILLFGLVLSAFAFVVNLKGVPIAATFVRTAALQTAIKKLESPVEPGAFNTDLTGYTVYAKAGEVETGRWKSIFIFNEDKAGSNIRMITSESGRLDQSGQTSELVLENATVATIPLVPGAGKYISETIGEVRLAIRTRRGEMIQKLTASQITPEELGLEQLSEYADAREGRERTEALILWYRRIVLSISPLIFCLLGTAIVLRFNRGGRGFGSALALVVLIGFYLLTFLGEQLARVGAVSSLVGAMIPVLGSLAAVAWFSIKRGSDFWRTIGNYLTAVFSRMRSAPEKIQVRNLFVDLTTGLRDFDLLRNLIKNFALTLGFLVAIFLIFTAFELWKFAGTMDGGVGMLLKYLVYLLPYVYLQIAPSAAMIALIATYVIKSRENEVVTWASAGQSVFRLLAPAFVAMLILGAGNWLLQESVLPTSNRLQDSTRTLIRSRGVVADLDGVRWAASGDRIYSFKLPRASDNEIGELLKRITVTGDSIASDNEGRDGGDAVLTWASRGASDNERRDWGDVVLSGDLTGASDNGQREMFDAVLQVTSTGASDNDKRDAGGKVLTRRETSSLDNERQKGGETVSTRVRIAVPDNAKQKGGDAVLTRGQAGASDNEKLGVSGVVSAGGQGGTAGKESPGREINVLTGVTSRALFLTGMPGLPGLFLTASASDNEKSTDDCSRNCVRDVSVYVFAPGTTELQTLYRSEFAVFRSGQVLLSGTGEIIDMRGGKLVSSVSQGANIVESADPFRIDNAKTSHLNSSELKRELARAEAGSEQRSISIALQKKRLTLFLPFVLALLVAPFSLSLSRKGKAAAISYAIGLWLLFTGVSSILEQLSLNGGLDPVAAIWSPAAIFALIGVYLLSKIRT